MLSGGPSGLEISERGVVDFENGLLYVLVC